jgi:hypothetical protein
MSGRWYVDVSIASGMITRWPSNFMFHQARCNRERYDAVHRISGDLAPQKKIEIANKTKSEREKEK